MRTAEEVRELLRCWTDSREGARSTGTRDKNPMAIRLDGEIELARWVLGEDNTISKMLDAMHDAEIHMKAAFQEMLLKAADQKGPVQ